MKIIRSTFEQESRNENIITLLKETKEASTFS